MAHVPTHTDEDAASAPYGQWLGLAQMSLKFAFGVAGVGAGAPGVDLVSALLGIQSSDAVLLKAIKADTALIRTGDFTAAKLQVAEAQRVGPKDRRYAGFLERATELLYRAHGLCHSVEERAVVEMQLAMVWLAQGHVGDAEHWLARAADAAQGTLDALVDRTQRGPAQISVQIVDCRTDATRGEHFEAWRKVRRGVLGAAVLTMGWGLTFGPAVSVATDKQQKKRIAQLTAYLGFYNTVVIWRSRLFDEPIPRPLVLVSEGVQPDNTHPTMLLTSGDLPRA